MVLQKCPTRELCTVTIIPSAVEAPFQTSAADWCLRSLLRFLRLEGRITLARPHLYQMRLIKANEGQPGQLGVAQGVHGDAIWHALNCVTWRKSSRTRLRRLRKALLLAVENKSLEWVLGIHICPLERFTEKEVMSLFGRLEWSFNIGLLLLFFIETSNFWLLLLRALQWHNIVQWQEKTIEISNTMNLAKLPSEDTFWDA